jgi:hypothetical protein
VFVEALGLARSEPSNLTLGHSRLNNTIGTLPRLAPPDETVKLLQASPIVLMIASTNRVSAVATTVAEMLSVTSLDDRIETDTKQYYVYDAFGHIIMGQQICSTFMNYAYLERWMERGGTCNGQVFYEKSLELMTGLAFGYCMENQTPARIGAAEQ